MRREDNIKRLKALMEDIKKRPMPKVERSAEKADEPKKKSKKKKVVKKED